MRVVFIVVLLVLATLYISYYYRHPQELAILQTTLNEFSLDMLMQKHPLVLEDRVSDIHVLETLWFKYNLKTKFSIAPSDTWNNNKYKYLIVQATPEKECVVFVSHPKAPLLEDGAPDPEKTKLVGIKLAPLQSVILPFHAKYMIQDGHVTCIGIHDIITFLLP